MSSIVALPGTAISPLTAVHQVLNYINDIDVVLFVVRTKDGDIHVGHSAASDSQLVHMAVSADEFMRQSIRDSKDRPRSPDIPPPPTPKEKA